MEAKREYCPPNYAGRAIEKSEPLKDYKSLRVFVSLLRRIRTGENISIMFWWTEYNSEGQAKSYQVISTPREVFYN